MVDAQSLVISDEFWSAYRCIFAVIFTCNVATILGISLHARDWPPAPSIGSATSANLLAVILFRQENFVNLLYEIFTSAPHSWPVTVRSKLAKVFHYGGQSCQLASRYDSVGLQLFAGVHSACGVTAVFWHVFYTVLVTRNLFVQSRNVFSIVNVATSYALILIFLAILIHAHPRFRSRHHDQFEIIHRFAGWSALIIFWVHTVVGAKAAAIQQQSTLVHFMLEYPNFYFLLLSTCCTLLSWSRLRRVKVRAEVLSDHATRLHFDYRSMPSFYGIKISNRPVLEYHAFATIPEPNGEKGFSVVVSNAGDFTNDIIKSRPFP